jgi:hypothetical protein
MIKEKYPIKFIKYERLEPGNGYLVNTFINCGA